MYHLGQKFHHPQNLSLPANTCQPPVFRVQSITWWVVRADSGGGWSVQPHLVVRVQQSQRTAAGCTSLSSCCHGTSPQIPCKRSGESKLQSCCAKSRTSPTAPKPRTPCRAGRFRTQAAALLEKAKKESEIYLRGGRSLGFGTIS